MFVSDPAHVAAFDAVFASVFGAPAGDEREPSEDAPDRRRAARRAAARPIATGRPAPRGPARAPAPPAGEDDGAELEVPVGTASDEEVLAGKRFDALEPHELAQLYRLMSRLRLATPLRRTRRHERGRTAGRSTCAGRLRAQPAHRRRADPARPPAPPRAPPAAGDAVRHLRLDGALRPRLPAVPHLRRRQRGATSRRSPSPRG